MRPVVHVAEFDVRLHVVIEIVMPDQPRGGSLVLPVHVDVGLGIEGRRWIGIAAERHELSSTDAEDRRRVRPARAGLRLKPIGVARPAEGGGAERYTVVVGVRE